MWRARRLGYEIRARLWRTWWVIERWLDRYKPLWFCWIAGHVYRGGAAFARWLHPRLPASPIRVFIMGDCDYVAAKYAWQAWLWYVCEHGTDVSEVGEVPIEGGEFYDGELGDPDARLVTYQEGIDERAAQGGKFPFVLCTDGHYC